MLDPRRRLFAHRLFRGACLRMPVPGGALLVKDVGRLGRDLARTVLVDNTPAVRARSPARLLLARKSGCHTLPWPRSAPVALQFPAVEPLIRCVTIGGVLLAGLRPTWRVGVSTAPRGQARWHGDAWGAAERPLRAAAPLCARSLRTSLTTASRWAPGS